MNEALKKLALVAHATLVAKTVEKAVTCDALDDLQIGQTFTFDAVNRTKTGRLMVEGIVEKVCHMDLAKLMQHGPFTIVATYKGALTDVVCQDVSGEHFMLPSGVFVLLKRFENGDLPPELPFGLDFEDLRKAA
ncbi:hypothetical protein LUZ100_gp06 [Pseudomonas phage LUZ100]|nr:hypothetical protein LUZ100_gp06 [Pseudomonas phage LUZ100]